MVLQTVFVTHDRSVELISQFVDCRVQILMVCLDEDILALHTDIDLSVLPAILFFLVIYTQQHCDVDHLVEVPDDAGQFVYHILMQRWRDIQVMATNFKVQGSSPINWLACGGQCKPVVG